MDSNVLPPTFVEDFHYAASVKKTRYKRLGATDMIVSKLGLGGSPFGGVYRECNEKTVADIVFETLKNGVNYIDTSYWYGQGKSEEYLGKALSKIPRNAYYIGTKIGRYELDYERMFDFSAEKTFRMVDEALMRLRLPYVDLLQIHDFEFCPDVNIILEQTLPALEKIKASGKARYIGITAYPLPLLQTVVERSKVQIDTVLSYSRATLHDSSLRHFLPFFESKNIGIINAAPTSMGLLTNQGPPDWHPAPIRIQKFCSLAGDYCREQNVDIAKLAMNFGLNFHGVSTTLVGIDRLELVKKNLETSWAQLTNEEQACFGHIMDKYFAPNGDAHWEKEQMAYLDYYKNPRTKPS